MIPTRFDHFAPKTIAGAVRLLTVHKDKARLLAGGHSLIPMMKLRLATPEVLVDLGSIPGLNYIKQSKNLLLIGAMTTYWDIETSALVNRLRPMIAEAAYSIGDVQVRNRGTIGGCLAHADPSADMTAPVLAAHAVLELTGPKGKRLVPAKRFFLDVMTTAIRPGEVLTRISIPIKPLRTGETYLKFANKASHYAIVGLAASITLGHDDRCRSVSIAVTGASSKPARLETAEREMLGKAATPEIIAAASRAAGENLDYISDLHGSGDFRAHLVKTLASRALTIAVTRAR